MKQSKPSLTDYLLLGGLALIFALSFVFTNIAVGSISPLTVATSRLLLAAVILYSLMKFKGHALPTLGHVWVYIVAAAFTRDHSRRKNEPL